MTTYVCKNQFQVSNSSNTSLFSTTASPNIYGDELSSNVEQQQGTGDKDYLSTPDSAISISDNLSLSPKTEYDLFSQSNETLPSTNSSNSTFYHQQLPSYDYPDYHSNGNVVSHLNMSATKEYLHNVICSGLPDPYALPLPPQSTNPLVQLESFTKEALSNVTPFPKTSLPLPVDYSINGKSSSGFIKPPCSYPCLIAIALNNAFTNRLNVSELYDFIQFYFPFFQRAPEGWKNSVRHNLSTNGWFNKVDEGRSGYAGRRSFLWGFSSPGIKEKAINDVRKQVLKKYKDMCDSIICSSLLEPLLNGERGFTPTSCYQSPFIGCNNTGLANIVKRGSDYTCSMNNTYHSQPTFNATSPIVVNQKGTRKRSSRLMQSASVDESNLHYGSNSTSYQPNVKKQYDEGRSFSPNSNNSNSRLISQDFPNYMLPCNFPFTGDGSQRHFNLYRQQLPTYSPISDTSYSYPLAKSPSVSSQGGVDFYSSSYTVKSESYPPVADSTYDKNKRDSTNNTSITSGSSSSTISTNEQRTSSLHDLSTGSWNQTLPVTSMSSSTLQRQPYESLERTIVKNEPFLDEVLNEFFIPT